MRRFGRRGLARAKRKPGEGMGNFRIPPRNHLAEPHRYGFIDLIAVGELVSEREACKEECPVHY